MIDFSSGLYEDLEDLKVGVWVTSRIDDWCFLLHGLIINVGTFVAEKLNDSGVWLRTILQVDRDG